MHIAHYIDLIHRTEKELARAFIKVSAAHGDEPDVCQTCRLLARWSEKMEEQMKPFLLKYNPAKDKEPDRLTQILLQDTRKGGIALLRDLHDLYLIAIEVQTFCIILRQASDGLRDKALTTTCEEVEKQTKRQLNWLMTSMKAAAPQTLIVSE